MAAFKPIETKSSGKGMGILKGAVTGFATGGPVGALIGAGTGLLAGSPAGKALEIGQTANSLSKLGSSPMEMGQPKEMPAQYNPMEQRMQALQQDPKSLAMQGLDILKDPSIPHDLRMELAPQFLKIKYYGGLS